MLRKDAFKWTLEATTAFEQLRQAIITPLVLALLDFQKPFVIETDAFGVGIMVVLMQGGHPIAYISRALLERNILLST